MGSNGNNTAFNIRTVNLMIGMFDKEKKGEINFEDFGFLWRYIVDWQSCFRNFDRSNQQAVNFDDFIQCCLVLQGLTDAFRREDTKMDGSIQLSYERFLIMILGS